MYMDLVDFIDMQLRDVEILYDVYRYDLYKTEFIVLFIKNNELFIAENSYCNCYEFKDKWHPIKTCEKTLKMEIECKSKKIYEEFECFIPFCKDYFKWDK